MAVSDAQYKAWLADDNKQRVLLVEAQAYSGSSVVTHYLATRPFVSLPADTPANQVYDDLIASVPSFSRSLAEHFNGSSAQSWGDIVVRNTKGELDAWLQDGWDGRSLRLYLGGQWWARNDYRMILDGVTADITVRDATAITIKARDKQWMLNVPLQQNFIGGSSANAGKPKPICYGPCSNISPMLIDSSTHTYQVHDGPVNAISAVYSDGVSVAFTANLAAGTFTLAAGSTGRITADVQGAKPSSYLTCAADIIKDIVLTRTGLTSVDLDASSFSAFATLCPQAICLYVADRANVGQVLDQIIGSVGGWYGFSRAGKLQLGRIDSTSGTPVLSIEVDDIEARGVTIRRRDLPLASITLGHSRNWTVQSSGLGAGVTEARRAVLAADYQSVTVTQPSVLTKFPLADKPGMAETLLASPSDATAEANRRLALRNQVRCIYSIEAFSAPYQVDLGQIVQITYPRFGMAGGVTGVVVGLTERPTKNRLQLDVYI